MDSLNGGNLDHEAKGLVVVHLRIPSEPLKDLTSLVLIQSTIGLEHVTENPFAVDHIGAWERQHQVLGVVGQQGCILLRSTLPVGRVGNEPSSARPLHELKNEARLDLKLAHEQTRLV